MEKHTVRVRRSVALVALVAALLIGGTLDWAVSSSKNNQSVLATPHEVTLRLASASEPQARPASLTEGFANVVEPLLPAVVNISSSKLVKTQRSQNPFEDDPFFRQFFGNPNGNGGDGGNGGANGGGNGRGNGRGNGGANGGGNGGEQREHSLGSGVIVSPDGYILTNNHVVDGATDIEVSLNDKRQLKATVVGHDARTDIALLKIDAKGLAAVTIGSSAKMRIGDVVLAIGDPFGIGETVTMGIVSATGRRGLSIEGPEGYEDFIQTDASINPGNSGGALVNTRGELIGINTAIISNGGGGNQGIGFAIPIDMARRVMEQLMSTGKVTRGYLGVMIQEVTPQLAKAFNLPSAEGTLVGDVTPDSPGAKAGLQKGDVILGIDGENIADYADLRLRISQFPPGKAIKLQVIRGGKKIEMNATLTAFPEKLEAAAAAPAAGEKVLEGVQVDALTPDMAQRLNLPANIHGVVVTNVDPDSAAAEGGLQRGDVIQEVNHTPINTVDQFRNATRAAGGQPLLLLVNRNGNTAYTVISPQ